MPKGWNYEEVKSYIEDHGYELLSEEYVNKETKIKLRCPEGHKYFVTFGSFKNGSRCPYCQNKLRGNKRKLSYNYVKKYIEEEGHELLSTEYKDAHQKLKIRCHRNHIYGINFNGFKNGYRCPECNKINASERQRLSYDYVKDFIEKEGYTLLSENFKNARTKIKLQCPQGHILGMTFDSFQSGRKCKKCSNIIQADLQRFSYDYVKDFIEREGYNLLSKTYIRNCKKLKLKCPQGHICGISFAHFQNGKRCGKCFAGSHSSKPEREIKEHITNYITEEFVSNEKSLIKNPITNRYLELDIGVSQHRKAIEFNGIYWHSSEEVKEKDKFKQKECEKQRIDLMVIDEQDWIEDKNKVLKEVERFLQE